MLPDAPRCSQMLPIWNPFTLLGNPFTLLGNTFTLLGNFGRMLITNFNKENVFKNVNDTYFFGYLRYTFK